MRKILIVAAHPDDEVLGCGGTISRLAREGNSIFTLILGEGITARDRSRDGKERECDLKRLKKQALEANKILGVSKVFDFDFPDNRFDSIPLLDIVKVIEDVKQRIKPDTIFTHFGNDLNIDHRITYQAVITAARPVPGETVRKIYCYEVLSSTEWNYPERFSPDLFFEIRERDVQTKLDALRKYGPEMRTYPHPRSLRGVKINAAYWGMNIGKKYAEAFKIVRIIR